MSNLPTLKDLNVPVSYDKNQDKLNYILNLTPPKEWIKRNKFAGNSKYIPIERVEFLMRKIFKRYKQEVTGVKQIFNGVSVSLRVHYPDPLSGEWLFTDGVGAAQIQTKKGSSPADLSNINNNALQMCVPIAKTMAFKNACQSLGRIFGSDLNRDASPNYKTELIEFNENHPNWLKAVESVKNGLTTPEEIAGVYQMSDEAFKKLKSYEN